MEPRSTRKSSRRCDTLKGNRHRRWDKRWVLFGLIGLLALLGSGTIPVLDTATNAVVATVPAAGPPVALGQFVGSMTNDAVCDIQLSKLIYVNGDTVTATIRLAIPGTVPIPVELKLWREEPGSPGSPPISFLNVGALGDIVLPGGFNLDVKSLELFTVTSAVLRGQHAFNCRILDPVTKRLLIEDLNPFTIQ